MKATVPLRGVATPTSGPLHSSRPCEACKREIEKSRKGQRACSGRCRWALWKAGQVTETVELRVGLLVLRGLVDDLLKRVEGRRTP